MRLFVSDPNKTLLTENTSSLAKNTPMDMALPELKHDSCVSNSRIRAFLRLSRIATDDTIKQHLNEIKVSQCDSFFFENIAPQWQARSDVIMFCDKFAKTLRAEANLKRVTTNNDYDLRTDPYALRNAHDIIDSQSSRCAEIEHWVSNEEHIESIIREQTANVLSDKCHFKDWLQEFEAISRR